MQKLSNQSKDISQENIKKVEELFPNCVTETYDQDGNLVRSIDFDILRQDLSGHVVEGPKERYQFNWPGKREAILLANAPTTNTLRPLPEKSVDFEKTKNVYIEGDNLEALKILRETYMGKIDMIYIDPPYNTGNDFIYKDDFKQSTEDYLKSSGSIDEEGNCMEVNGESNGRFHSDWLDMIYSRLVLARSLLKDTGAIFISIDDNESETLKMVCNEIFGEENFVMQIAWRRTDNQPNIGNIARVKEYILCFSKKRNELSVGHLPLSDKAKLEYRYQDSKGYFRRKVLLDKTRGRFYYDVITKGGRVIKGPWMVSKGEFERMDKNGEIYWTNSGDELPYGKKYLSIDDGQIPSDFWGIEFGTNQRASEDVLKLFGQRVFDFPKPVSLLSNLAKIGMPKDGLILDFFAGSSTIADSIFQLNSIDNGTRNFILVQLPEECKNNEGACKLGFHTICDIGEERIRRAGEKIKDSNPLTSQNLDAGFRVYKIDSSNMKDILSTPKDTQLSLLENADSAIKPDRNSLDLVTQVMLQLGITLDADIRTGICAEGGGHYYAVNGNDLICCFEKNISESDIEEIARMQPLNVAFRDDSFASDQDEVNCEQIFKTLSPITGKNIFVL